MSGVRAGAAPQLSGHPDRDEHPTAAAQDAAPRRRAETSRAVLWTGAVVAAAGLGVLATVPTDAAAVGMVCRGLAVLLLWLVAPGAALLAGVGPGGVRRAALVPLVGLSALLGASTVGAWTGVWVPLTATVGVGGLSLVVCLARLALMPRLGERRGSRPLPPDADPAPDSAPDPDPDPDPCESGARASGPLRAATAAALVACVATWVASLPGVAQTPLSSTGLLVAGPWSFRVAVALAVLAFLLALRTGSWRWSAGGVLALVLVLRTTAAATSTAPMYAWTYKHLGVVDILQHYHHTLADGGIYQAWPAMFAAAAWFSDASAVAPLDVARWTTPVVQVLLALQVAALARALGSRGVGCAAAAGLAVALNWVGQDYYAPQAVAMVLAAGILVLVVRGHRAHGWGLLAVAVFACMVPSHQLTPFWVLGVVLVLAVLRRAPWWLPLAMAAVVVAFLWPRLAVVASYGLLSGFDPLANAAGNAPAGGGEGRALAAVAARSSVGVVWLTAAAVLAHRAVLVLRSRWHGPSRRPLAMALRLLRSRSIAVPALMSFSSVALLGGQSYGGEAILRVVLYSVPGCAAVLGPPLARWAASPRLPVRLAAVLWSLAVVGITGQAYFGAWSVNRIQPQDVEAERDFLTGVAPPAYLLPVLPDWPERLTRDDLDFYAQDDQYSAALSVAGYAGAYDDPSEVSALVRRLSQLEPAPLYVVFSGSMDAYDAFYGIFPDGGYENLRDGLLARPDFTLVEHEGDLWVLQYTAAGWPVR